MRYLLTSGQFHAISAIAWLLCGSEGGAKIRPCDYPWVSIDKLNIGLKEVSIGEHGRIN